MSSTYLGNLLLLGIILILAAVIGGGLQAANIVTIPVLTNRVARGIIGIIGAAIMGFAYVSIQSSGAQAARADFEARYDRLVMGASAIPTPPAWSVKAVADELEELAENAGGDVAMNCEITNFMRVHQVPISEWPTVIQERFRSASQGGTTGDLVCYQRAIAAEKVIAQEASRRSGTCAAPPVGGATPSSEQSYAPVRAVSFAQFDSFDSPPIGPIDLAQSSEIAPQSAGTSILESIATVGQSGWIYLGEYTANGTLGPDRTVIQDMAPINGIVTIRAPVNLRAAGADTNYHSHEILSVIPPGTQVLIKALTPRGEPHAWALIVIDKIQH